MHLDVQFGIYEKVSRAKSTLFNEVSRGDDLGTLPAGAKCRREVSDLTLTPLGGALWHSGRILSCVPCPRAWLGTSPGPLRAAAPPVA
jgi:hypothetical protein